MAEEGGGGGGGSSGGGVSLTFDIKTKRKRINKCGVTDADNTS